MHASGRDVAKHNNQEQIPFAVDLINKKMKSEEQRELFSLSLETPEIPQYDPVSNWASAVSVTKK